MFNKNKRLPYYTNLLQQYQMNTKVTLIFSYRTGQVGYDEWEQVETENYLNPKTIKAYVASVTAEASVYKLQGMSVRAAKEIICDDKYYEWFKLCTKLQIDGEEYQVFRLGGAFNNEITKRPCKLMRVYAVQKLTASTA